MCFRSLVTVSMEIRLQGTVQASQTWDCGHKLCCLNRIDSVVTSCASGRASTTQPTVLKLEILRFFLIEQNNVSYSINLIGDEKKAEIC